MPEGRIRAKAASPRYAFFAAFFSLFLFTAPILLLSEQLTPALLWALQPCEPSLSPSTTRVLKPTSFQGTLGTQREEKKCRKIRPRAETNCSISHEQSSLGAVCSSAFHLWEGKINSTGRRARGAGVGKAVSEAGWSWGAPSSPVSSFSKAGRGFWAKEGLIWLKIIEQHHSRASNIRV